MNKIFYIISIILILLTSCTPFDWDEARGELIKKNIENEYQISFAEEFGTYGVLNIDPNHEWGFKNILSEIELNTRTAVPNANQWGVDPYNLNVPKPLTQKQKDFVTEWFTNTLNPNSIAINWTDYFAQQVSSTIYGNHMDALYDNGDNYNNHVYNFNSGNCSETNVQGSDGQWKDRIMLMQGQSTTSFSYHETVSNTTWYDHYVIIPGEVIDPTNSLNEESIHGMFFLGFDYEAYKFEGSLDNVKRDYYFNDWIVKLTPAIPTKPEPLRIMAEDLGSIGDFDFNDVVFDVYINYNQWWHGNDYGIIILHAAGGTMPLYVDNHEVHKEFNVPTTQMVNTNGLSTVNRPIVLWRFIPTSANPIDIPILVENTKENVNYLINSEIGIAPGKIAVPISVKWSNEQVNIKTTYPKFNEWIEDQTKYFWN